MDEIVRLVRPEIYAMQPYLSARLEGSQDADVLLDANENPYPPYPGTAEQEGLNRYPEPQPQVLLDRFAELYRVPAEHLLLSRGADEAIDLLVRAFCAAGRDGILVTPPTFVMYRTAARIQGAHVVEVPLVSDTFDLDVPAMLTAHDRDPSLKLVFVCSPNNPTANLMDRQAVLRLAATLFGRALVVVDQTYVEYSGQSPYTDQLASHPNLVVLRTVSKEYSLAGERLGITVAHPEVIGVLRRLMAPYPIPVSVVRTVAAAMSPAGIAVARDNLHRVLVERHRLEKGLIERPSVRRIWPSDTNYLLVDVTAPAALTDFLATRGVKVRDRSSEVPGALRISAGTPEETDRLLAAWRAYEELEAGKPHSPRVPQADQ